jgi:hypothetical protein
MWLQPFQRGASATTIKLRKERGIIRISAHPESEKPEEHHHNAAQVKSSQVFNSHNSKSSQRMQGKNCVCACWALLCCSFGFSALDGLIYVLFLSPFPVYLWLLMPFFRMAEATHTHSFACMRWLLFESLD